MPICSNCGNGFDRVEGEVPTCPKCGAPWAPPPRSLQGLSIGDPSFGNLFLFLAKLICSVGCVFSVLKTIVGLWTVKQFAAIISVPTDSTLLAIVVILLDGFVWFCLNGALIVVFSRCRR